MTCTWIENIIEPKKKEFTGKKRWFDVVIEYMTTRVVRKKHCLFCIALYCYDRSEFIQQVCQMGRNSPAKPFFFTSPSTFYEYINTSNYLNSHCRFLPLHFSSISSRAIFFMFFFPLRFRRVHIKTVSNRNATRSFCWWPKRIFYYHLEKYKNARSK